MFYFAIIFIFETYVLEYKLVKFSHLHLKKKLVFSVSFVKWCLLLAYYYRDKPLAQNQPLESFWNLKSK